jgi:2-aminoadipate transaminase
MRISAGSFGLSSRMSGLAPSAVREILKVADRRDVISFAGGLPAPELFPLEAIAEAFARTFADVGPRALQYGVTEGYLPLREWIAARLARRGVETSPENLLVTSGAQQGIDLVARALLDPGDIVVTENPTYLAALQVFAAAEAEVVPVGGDDEGICVAELPDVLTARNVRLIYVCPDFSNPRGTTLSARRREQLVEIARRYRVPILEDDPYGELRYTGEAPPAIAAFDETVIRLGTFSKILAPGLRIGWLHGPEPLVRRLAILKQTTDLHTATLAQHATAKLLETFNLDVHVSKLRATYGARRDAMLDALLRVMPKGTVWTKPGGGLFVWLALPEGSYDAAVFDAALARGVAVVPGAGFFVGDPSHRFLRLNFSNRPKEEIETGIATLAASIESSAA